MCGVPSTMPSPGGLFAFACIGGEKGIVWKEEGPEAMPSTLRAVWRTVEVGGGHPSLRRRRGKWALRESPIKTEG